MSRVAKFPKEAEDLAKRLVADENSARDVKKGLSVTLAVGGWSNERIAEALQVSAATVVRMHREVREGPAAAAPEAAPWGGRRNQLMSEAAEEAFLRPYLDEAESGGILVVPPIHAALREHLGRKVALSTVYRMLHRHGWRKLAPDSAHPKQDKEAQEAFKKGGSRKRWTKL